MGASFALSWVRADDEIQQPTPTTKVKKVIPRLTCEGHKWGMWMTDNMYIDTPWGKQLIPQSIGNYRRFCTRRGCKAKQMGYGSAWGVNITPVDIASTTK
jgi:hypothetical protein